MAPLSTWRNRHLRRAGVVVLTPIALAILLGAALMDGAVVLVREWRERVFPDIRHAWIGGDL